MEHRSHRSIYLAVLPCSVVPWRETDHRQTISCQPSNSNCRQQQNKHPYPPVNRRTGAKEVRTVIVPLRGLGQT